MCSSSSTINTSFITSLSGEQRREQGHAHEEAVAGLAEVGGAWVGVDLRAYLVDPGRGMQHDRRGARASHRGVIDHVAAGGPPVRVEARKALLLHPRLIEHVDLSGDGGQIIYLLVG